MRGVQESMNENKMEYIIREALYQLLKNKNMSFDDLNVSAIAKKAGISRVTFYNYFLDIYDLFQWMTQTRINELLDFKIENKQDLYTFLNHYFSIADDYGIVIKKALDSQKSLDIYKMTMDSQIPIAKKILGSNYFSKGKFYHNVDVSILSSLLYGSYIKYIFDDKEISAKDEIVAHLIENFLEPLLRNDKSLHNQEKCKL